MLIDYLNNQIEDDAHVAVDAHLATCADCRAALAAARDFLASARTHTSATPPPGLIRRALAAFRQIKQRNSIRYEPAALLQFDSWDLALPTGARGHTHDRQLLYRFMDFDIDVQITPRINARTYTIHGQILREAGALASLEGTAIRLLAQIDESNLRQTMVDDLGRFHLSHVAAGPYLLQIELADAKVRIGALTIGPRD